ncbi:MAG: UDP-N-acetylmuramate dehydrogenase [Acidobacteria bacterium]|nr:UDP-N-acetylmuramate dehydrogenase [Acidobacteriota bacterium]
MPLSSVNIRQNVPLAPYTTLGIGGPASYFAEITSEAALVEAVGFARERNLALFTVGGGSNLLVADSGFDGFVLHIAIDGPTGITIDGDTALHTVAAGVEWNAFVLSVCNEEISGVECLAGIPGSVGGTPVQNVGAYGQEVAETIDFVRALDLHSMTFVDLPRDQCGFSYRRSIFNSTARGRYIVTAVTFRFDLSRRPRLTYADLTRHFGDQQPTPIEVYHAVREIRYGKGMLLVSGEPDSRSAGSFFKNPIVPRETIDRIATALHLSADKVPHWPADANTVKLPAAWLLERAGFVKGYTMGEAGISSRHTLALINKGKAKAADVFALRDAIQLKVKTIFDIALEQEPVEPGQG